MARTRPVDDTEGRAGEDGPEAVARRGSVHFAASTLAYFFAAAAAILVDLRQVDVRRVVRILHGDATRVLAPEMLVAFFFGLGFAVMAGFGNPFGVRQGVPPLA